MSRTLGILTLPEGIVWQNRYDWSPVLQQAATTLGGRPVVFSQGLVEGRPIDLVAEDPYCWLEQDFVDDLMALAAEPGGVFDLIWDAERYQVVFRHEEPPACSCRPLASGCDQYTGTIKLRSI